jgi:hypothetical protein
MRQRLWPAVLILIATVLRVVPALAQAPAQGRIAGRVVDKDTGRPVAGARVLVEGQAGGYEADLNGNYRTGLLPLGSYSLRATMIGFRPVQVDSVRVTAGQTVTANFVLSAATVQLQELEVTSQGPVRSNNDAGLLAIQQAAPAVSDGISAQAIAKSPDQNAGDAIKRVTGVSIIDGKFLVVRGLGERYSNALLNGAEIASPVLEKKIPPLDLFPSGLLESVVASKTATPDKPGDFAGGSVELKTKDFPEQRIAQAELKLAGNDQTTFKDLPLAPQGGVHDWLGFAGSRRVPPSVPQLPNDPVALTGILQSFRNNVWNPAPSFVGLKPGFTLTYGDQKQGEQSSLGYIASVNYNRRVSYNPDRLYNLFYLGREGTNTVDWGGILNLAWKANSTNKIFLRNLYTRSADEQTRFASGASTQPGGVAPSDIFDAVYQVRYTERYIYQSQLGGEHRIHFPFAFPSFFEWKGTYGRARIYDPDNHSAKFSTNTQFGSTEVSAFRLTRDLTDRTYSGQLDWSIPLSLRRAEDALVKFGGYYRRKQREYDAEDFYLTGGNDPSVQTLVNTTPVVPEDVFAPENMGSFGALPREANDPYEATEKVSAAFGMLDLPLLPWLRAVGGLRLERWQLDILNGGDDPRGDKAAGKTSSLPTGPKDVTDKLWSVNLTVMPTATTNLRLAAYRTVARPDIREVAPSKFTSVNGLGECTFEGNPFLTRSLITNYDARLEVYARPGELIAISGFYKKFDQPIIAIRTTGSFGGSNVSCNTKNATSASLTGGEFEFRKNLDFLGLPRLSLGSNVAVVSSSINVEDVLGIAPRKFIGQSPVVVNGFAGYAVPSGGFEATLLFNYVGERLNTYANKDPGNQAVPSPNPNWVEQARATLDAKLRLSLSRRTRLAFSARNLTRAQVIIKEDSDPNRTVSQYNPGLSFSTSVTYDF